MLERLSIRDFALIEEARIAFGPGFNVLTGETGAGKSIILGALNAVLGEKTSADIVRTGSARALVEAVFRIPEGHTDLLRLLEDSGIPVEDSTLVVRREIGADGKGRVFVNDTTLTVGRLRDIGSLLVDLHGQHEHQSLLRTETHLAAIDRFGRLEEEVAAYRDLFDRFQALVRHRDRLRMDEAERRRTLDLLAFAIREIDEVSPQPGEDAELEAEIRRMAHAERLYAAADEAYAALYGDEDSAAARLGRAEADLDRMVDYDPSLAELRERLAAARAEVEDAAAVLRDYRQEHPYDPQDLDRKTERLHRIEALKKKYGPDIPAVLAYRRRAEEDLRTVTDSEEEERRLAAEIERAAKELVAAASRLSGRRRVVAKLLEEKVRRELDELGMKHAVFTASFASVEDEDGFLFEEEGRRLRLTRDGRDLVEFLFSANPGEEPRPLRRIASGGELSRVMLALKSVFAAADRIPTMVFDEIDTGISGQTALIVGRKIAGLAASKQVICVTHLPQIAARSHTHFTVRKEVRPDGRTVTLILPLDPAAKEREIARMLKGDRITETALASARELINHP